MKTLLLLIMGMFITCSTTFVRMKSISKALAVVLFDLALPQASFGASVQELLRDGSRNFAEGKLQESVLKFKEAESMQPSLRPYLWQKGIAEFGLGDYDSCASQFKADLTIPAHLQDSEESIFLVACEAKKQASQGGRYSDAINQLPKDRVADRRQVMNKVYEVFAQSQPPSSLAALVSSPASTMLEKQQQFYSAFYLGLYYESLSSTNRAIDYYTLALDTPYAKSQSDFMVTTCKVYRDRLI